MTATTWIEQYKKAWASNSPEDIRALFTDDAIYAGSPSEESPVTGIDEIISWWDEHGDDPGSYSFEYTVLADTGDMAFVQGVTDYSASGDPVYDNLWVIRFASDGRAREFTEWFMTRD